MMTMMDSASTRKRQRIPYSNVTTAAATTRTRETATINAPQPYPPVPRKSYSVTTTTTPRNNNKQIKLYQRIIAVLWNVNNKKDDDGDMFLLIVFTGIICVTFLIVIAVTLLIQLSIYRYGYLNLSLRGSSISSPATTTSTTSLHHSNHHSHHSHNTLYGRSPQQHQQPALPTILPVLPSSKVYTIPNSMAHIGDKSDKYAELRKRYDQEYPPDTPQRSLRAMHNVRNTIYDSLRPPTLQENGPHYDIYSCPHIPPPNYPQEYSTVDLLKAWPITQSLPTAAGNSTTIITARLGICVFDYGKDYIKILKYRQAEVPFVVQNDPKVAETVERWNSKGYLHDLLGSNNNNNNEKYRVEQSSNIEFLYWRPDVHVHKDKFDAETMQNWTAPTKLTRLSFGDWYDKAKMKQKQLEKNSSNNNNDNRILFYNTTTPTSSSIDPNSHYHYLRLIGCGESSPTGDCDKSTLNKQEWLFDELDFFQPKAGQLYLPKPQEQRGIHCRFGMAGIQAQNHFDASRNAIVVLGGQRRYILSSPQHCNNMALYPLGHPSARHTQINYTDVGISDRWKDEFPQFQQSKSNEVVLQAGDVLYLPTYWFHSIVSLSTNYQCNTRSGYSDENEYFIDKCGFLMKPKETRSYEKKEKKNSNESANYD